MKDKQ